MNIKCYIIRRMSNDVLCIPSRVIFLLSRVSLLLNIFPSSEFDFGFRCRVYYIVTGHQRRLSPRHEMFKYSEHAVGDGAPVCHAKPRQKYSTLLRQQKQRLLYLKAGDVGHVIGTAWNLGCVMSRNAVLHLVIVHIMNS